MLLLSKSLCKTVSLEVILSLAHNGSSREEVIRKYWRGGLLIGGRVIMAAIELMIISIEQVLSATAQSVQSLLQLIAQKVQSSCFHSQISQSKTLPDCSYQSFPVWSLSNFISHLPPAFPPSVEEQVSQRTRLPRLCLCNIHHCKP